jgi:hypothetical protein
MNFFHHKDLGNHLLQLCPTVVKHPVYWNILTMHGPINVKSPNNTSKWQMGFNSAFKVLSSNICGVLVATKYSIASLDGSRHSGVPCVLHN